MRVRKIESEQRTASRKQSSLAVRTFDADVTRRGDNLQRRIAWPRLPADVLTQPAAGSANYQPAITHLRRWQRQIALTW